MEFIPWRLKHKSEDDWCGDPSAQGFTSSPVWFLLHLYMMTQMKIRKTWINDTQEKANNTCPKHMHNWVRSVPSQGHSPAKTGSQVSNDDVGKTNNKTSMNDSNSPTSTRRRRAVCCHATRMSQFAFAGKYGFCPTSDRWSSWAKVVLNDK